MPLHLRSSMADKTFPLLQTLANAVVKVVMPRSLRRAEEELATFRFVCAFLPFSNGADRHEQQTPSVARNGHRATVDGEDVQTVTSAEERSRSRSRSRAPHGKLMEHTGRGGAGNVRMESKERERAAAAQEKLDQDVQSRYTAEQLQHHHHHGRGGAGNTV